MDYKYLNQYQQIAYERLINYICKNIDDINKVPLIELIDMLVEDCLEN